MSVEQTIANANAPTDTVGQMNTNQGLLASTSPPVDDFWETEIAAEKIGEILAQCYRIARERARKSYVNQGRGSNPSECSN